MFKRKFVLSLVLLVVPYTGTAQRGPQTKWYKFSKTFIDATFPEDSAFGELRATAWTPSKVHKVGCGGDDGEIHVGVSGDDVVLPNGVHGPVSALAADNSSDFGIVAEPPNATAAIRSSIKNGTGEIAFRGFYRVWNEGHDVGPEAASNPHHVLELHPAWTFQVNGETLGSPATVHSMDGYHGYGVSKYLDPA